MFATSHVRSSYLPTLSASRRARIWGRPRQVEAGPPERLRRDLLGRGQEREVAEEGIEGTFPAAAEGGVEGEAGVAGADPRSIGFQRGQGAGRRLPDQRAGEVEPSPLGEQGRIRVQRLVDALPEAQHLVGSGDSHNPVLARSGVEGLVVLRGVVRRGRPHPSRHPPHESVEPIQLPQPPPGPIAVFVVHIDQSLELLARLVGLTLPQKHVVEAPA